MIAKIKIGRDFVGALQYNLDKLEVADKSKRAEVLETNFSSLNIDDVRKELDYLKLLNPKLKRTTFHTSLNFGKDEEVSNEKMLSIAKEYMVKMGFKDNLYVIVRHRDTAHPHCHIVAHRTKLDGRTVSDGNSYLQNNDVLRGLEDKYGLQQVESIYNAKRKNVTKNEIEYVLRTGQPTAKMKMAAIISETLVESKGMVDFVNRLERRGLRIRFKQNFAGRPVGVLFFNSSGGGIIPGSKLRKDLSLNSILKHFSLQRHPKLNEFATIVNNRSRRFFGPNAVHAAKARTTIGIIKAAVKSSLAHSVSVDQFVQNLEGKKIHCLFNVAKTGLVTGLNLVYQGKSYKSSDIHRHLSASKILNKLNYEQARDSQAISTANARTRERFGDGIPRAGTGRPQYFEKESSGHLQSGKRQHAETSGTGRFVERNPGKAAGGADGDLRQSNKMEKPLSSLIDHLGNIINHRYHQDGLNTKRNNKRRNKPRL